MCSGRSIIHLHRWRTSRYYNIGLDVWFTALSFRGYLRWQSGGEPDAWRGQAATELAAAANNVDAVGDVVYIVNRNQFRITLTYTPGSNPIVRREWVNQRDLGAKILLPEADGNLRVATIDDVDRTIAIPARGYLSRASSPPSCDPANRRLGDRSRGTWYPEHARRSL